MEVPKTYAELAVHLTGSLIQFVIGQALAQKPQEQPATPSPFDDDNVPFWLLDRVPGRSRPKIVGIA